MAFFNFKKKETKTDGSCCSKNEGQKVTEGSELKSTCSCGNSCGLSDIKKARFIVLGACCKKSAETLANVQTAVRELGLTDEVLNIGDVIEIAKYGVMQTPALVIDSRVVSYGKLITVEEAKRLVQLSPL